MQYWQSVESYLFVPISTLNTDISVTFFDVMFTEVLQISFITYVYNNMLRCMSCIHIFTG